MSEADASDAAPTGREIWIEKYRPATLDNIYGQEDIVDRLQSYIDRDDLPHLLFAGPAGVGKCVTGSTPILTNQGIKQIGDIVGDIDGFAPAPQDLKVCSLTADGSFRYRHPSHVFGKRTRGLQQIQTNDGATLTVTPEHKLLIRTSEETGPTWVPAADITAGMQILRAKNIPVPAAAAESSGGSDDVSDDLSTGMEDQRDYHDALTAEINTRIVTLETLIEEYAKSQSDGGLTFDLAGTRAPAVSTVSYLLATVGIASRRTSTSGSMDTETSTHAVSIDGSDTARLQRVIETDWDTIMTDQTTPTLTSNSISSPAKTTKSPLSTGKRQTRGWLHADGGMTHPSIQHLPLHADTVTINQSLDVGKRVYDLTVPGVRNYVGGHIPTVMHNTTAATAIAHAVYGDDWQNNLLELNASDERGIDVVRDRIKNFARSSFGGYDHRIIFLDEADSLTDDAQSALRRTMEQFADNTRFILSCNYSSKIIDPIQSRCAVFRFSPLSEVAVRGQIKDVAAAENIELTEDGLDALVYAAGGDMRRAINSLQAAATTGEVVDEETVYTITSTARPEDIETMVTAAIEGDFATARSQLQTLLVDTGMAGGDIIDQLHRTAWNLELDEQTTVRLLERVGEADYRITVGANEQVQLEALLASLADTN
jgi:replication factor C small subunit